MTKAFESLKNAGFTGTWEEAFTFDEGVWKYSAKAYSQIMQDIKFNFEKDKEKLENNISQLSDA